MNLLRAHGSPTRHQYAHHGCRCVCCRASQAEFMRRYYEDNHEKRLEYHRRYNETNRQKIAEGKVGYRLISKYGITREERDAILAAQGGSCAICHTTDANGNGWQVDHDHATGRIRGVLCTNCNVAVGMVGDDPAILRAAAAYLESC